MTIGSSRARQPLSRVNLTVFTIENYTAKVGQDNVNIGVVTIFRLANTSLLLYNAYFR